MESERFISLDAVIHEIKEDLKNCKPPEVYDDVNTVFQKRVIPKLLKDVIDYLEKQPVVDAVEVVHCGSCRFAQDETADGWMWCNNWCNGTTCDGYCHCGERKEHE